MNSTRTPRHFRLTQILAATSLILLGNPAGASELLFPTTEAEIVKALSLAPETTLQVKSLGKGLQAVKTEPPKVGALIHFDTNSATIKTESYPLLREYANALQGSLTDVVLEIAGHTDSQGSEEYNKGLSIRRAQKVKEFLVLAYQIDAHRLTIKSYGESQPIAPNTTLEGREQNRRVEFIRVR
ncbi:MAG: hypothetical protein DRR19_26465 [Candidatus Parabeggiatoa sp. nov. 1]|nr:MAG: hypothetical protein DRR19_26465 [Gammaproteobacteria bacterium]